jgi:predicted DCC family thiol-disulfide oxidoreductase YuxK
LKSKLEELFGADLRSLAVVRIGIAAIILFDLVERSTDLKAHYTDFGIIPRSFAIARNSQWFVSIHLVNGMAEIQAILFVLAGICALALLVGYKTRLATLFSWILFISLVSRNSYIVSGADSMLRLILFWGIFLPWGSRYSLDEAWSIAPSRRPPHAFSMGTIGFVAQILFIYWFSVLLKSGTQWRSEGTAIYYALSLDYMSTGLGIFLLQFPILLKLMTFGVFWFELIGPLLLLSPFFTGPLRTAGVLGFWLLHLGILTTLRIGFFPVVNMVAVCFFLPAWFWEKLASRIERRGADLKIFYDSACGLCWKTVRLVQTFFLLPDASLVPAQNSADTEAAMKGHSSWIVEAEGTRFFRYDAVIAAAKASPVFRFMTPVLAVAPMHWLGEKLYRYFASHRSSACPIEPARQPQQASGFALKPLTSAALTCALIVMFIWNLAILPWSGVKVPQNLALIANLFRLDQNWKMFAPYPPLTRGWFVIPGKLKDGTMVDLFREGRALDWSKPRRVSSIYKNHRWRKFGESLLIIKGLPEMYAQYLCRDWNRTHKGTKKLDELEITYLREQTPGADEYVTSEKVSVLKHECAAVDSTTK